MPLEDLLGVHLVLRVATDELALHQLLEGLPSPWERAAPLVLHQVVEAVHGDGLARLRVHENEAGYALDAELLRQLVLWDSEARRGVGQC